MLERHLRRAARERRQGAALLPGLQLHRASTSTSCARCSRIRARSSASATAARTSAPCATRACPTFMLTHWARDRAARHPARARRADAGARHGAVHRSHAIAARSRSACAPISTSSICRALCAAAPGDAARPPAGGKRLVQRADGYRATIVARRADRRARRAHRRAPRAARSHGRAAMIVAARLRRARPGRCSSTLIPSLDGSRPAVPRAPVRRRARAPSHRGQLLRADVEEGVIAAAIFVAAAGRTCDRARRRRARCRVRRRACRILWRLRAAASPRAHARWHRGRTDGGYAATTFITTSPTAAETTASPRRCGICVFGTYETADG